MRIVLDTNVIISMIFFPSAQTRELAKRLTEDHQIIVCDYFNNKDLGEDFTKCFSNVKKDVWMMEEKKSKLLKEICDIDQRQKRLQKLIVENNMQELNDYLEGELTRKYYVEKCIYNMPSNSKQIESVLYQKLKNISIYR